MLAATMYTDDENFRRMLVICASCTPIEKWHSEQNAECRSTDSSLPFMKKRVMGSSWDPLLGTMEYIQSYEGLAYMQFILCKGECELDIDREDHPAIAFENEMAALALEMALPFIGCRLRRTLWYCRGWPWRFCTLGAGVPPEIQAKTSAALRLDHDTFQEFIQVHGMQHTALAKRSCFNTACAAAGANHGGFRVAGHPAGAIVVRQSACCCAHHTGDRGWLQQSQGAREEGAEQEASC